MLRALGPNRPGFITVVTDMVSTHAFWYHPKVDLCIVATEVARQRALSAGLAASKVKVVGLPVADRFCHPAKDRQALRRELGWPLERSVVMLVGGGEGMGPLEKTAHAIAEGCLSAALVVIAGRNQALKERLEEEDWPIPTFVYGFVHEMPNFMAAADILVTKAGPGTISEALISELPMVLYSRLPGQEDGNVTYIINENAVVWAARPPEIVAAIQHWLLNREDYTKAVEACKRLARPEAAREIAQILADRVQIRA